MCAGSTPEDSRKLDEAQAFGAQVVLLGHRVDAQAGGGLGQGAVARQSAEHGRGLPSAAACQLVLGGDVQAIEPDQRLLDLVGFEADAR